MVRKFIAIGMIGLFIASSNASNELHQLKVKRDDHGKITNIKPAYYSPQSFEKRPCTSTDENFHFPNISCPQNFPNQCWSDWQHMYRELNDPNDLYKAFCVSDDVKTDMKLDANELSPDDVIQVSSSVQFFCRKCDNLLDSDYFNFLMEAEFKEEISDEKPEIYCEAAGVLEGKETTQYYVPNLSDEATKKNFKAKYKKLGFKNALTVNRKVQYSSIYCVGVLTKWEANHVTFNELQEGIKNQSLVSNDNTENKNRNNWFIICAAALFLGGLCYFFGCNASNEEILPDVDCPSNYFPSAKDLVLQVKEIGSVQSIEAEVEKNEEKTKAEDVKKEEEEEAEAEKNEEEEETKGEESKEEEEEAKGEKTKEETITPDNSKN